MAGGLGGGRGQDGCRRRSPRARGATSWRCWPAPARSGCGPSAARSPCAASRPAPGSTPRGRWSSDAAHSWYFKPEGPNVLVSPADETPERAVRRPARGGGRRPRDRAGQRGHDVGPAVGGQHLGRPAHVRPRRRPGRRRGPRLRRIVLAGRPGRLRHPDRAGHGPLPHRPAAAAALRPDDVRSAGRPRRRAIFPRDSHLSQQAVRSAARGSRLGPMQPMTSPRSSTSSGPSSASSPRTSWPPWPPRPTGRASTRGRRSRPCGRWS